MAKTADFPSNELAISTVEYENASDIII